MRNHADGKMLQAVHAVHLENVVHTDLKPANFVLVKGRLKIIDFGIAKAVANDTVNIQRDQQIGTVNYMSPEAISKMTNLNVLKVSLIKSRVKHLYRVEADNSYRTLVMSGLWAVFYIR
jgi:serine/threonine protein kinase